MTIFKPPSAPGTRREFDLPDYLFALPVYDPRVIGGTITKDGEILYDLYRPHDPVYAPGFGPDDPHPTPITRQEFKDECDINVIMKQYEGAWPPPPFPGTEQYLDFSFMPQTLLEAHEFLDSATVEFMKLPAEVRATFDNNAFAFVDYATNPDNLNQMREWGLAPKPPPPAAPSAPPSPPAPPPPPPTPEAK